MVRIIMYGCNGKMGQVITKMIAADPDAEIVAGIDARDDGHNSYPVFATPAECNVEADCVIDFGILCGKEASLSGVHHRLKRRAAGKVRPCFRKDCSIKIRQYVPGREPPDEAFKGSGSKTGACRL